MLDFAKKALSSITSDPEQNSPRGEDAEKDNSPEALEEQQRQEFHARIIALWQKVWFGLYQLYDRDGPYHHERLEKLYLGAGMATQISEDNNDGTLRVSPGLGLLRHALSHNCRGSSSSGLSGLKLYEGLSLEKLQSVIQLLEAYEREIEPLGEVYALLRGLQVGLRQPTTEDQEAVMSQYPALADPIAKRLLHYDSQLDVLAMDMEDEARAKHEDPKLQRGWYVSDVVLQRPRKFGAFASSARKYLE